MNAILSYIASSTTLSHLKARKPQFHSPSHSLFYHLWQSHYAQNTAANGLNLGYRKTYTQTFNWKGFRLCTVLEVEVGFRIGWLLTDGVHASCLPLSFSSLFDSRHKIECTAEGQACAHSGDPFLLLRLQNVPFARKSKSSEGMKLSDHLRGK